MVSTEKLVQKKTCIIGAGPAGLAALKVVVDSPYYKSGGWKVVCFEARENVGGIWNPSEPSGSLPLTPLYDSLTTNIPHPVMAYTSYPFPPSTPIFPPASTVQTYLEDYTSHFNLRPHIQFNKIVEDVSWFASRSVWSVRLLGGITHYFDSVIVANGHFRKPRYPDIHGLSEWLRLGRGIHSAWYRRPGDLPLDRSAGACKVVVVGNGPSGQDIASDLLLDGCTVIRSIQGAAAKDNGGLKIRGVITQFHADGSITFEDGSQEPDIDLCILATGYEMSFPFLSSVISLGLPDGDEQGLWNSSYHVYPLAKHLFPIGCGFPPSSLAFMGLILRGTPLSLFEAQAHAVVKVFMKPEALDIAEERRVIQARHRQLGPDELNVTKLWHKFTEPEAFEYRD
ncbi:monooxygenase, partial [Marasmius crinis-equi]